jgi:hypothetical protein
MTYSDDDLSGNPFTLRTPTILRRVADFLHEHFPNPPKHLLATASPLPPLPNFQNAATNGAVFGPIEKFDAEWESGRLPFRFIPRRKR